MYHESLYLEYNMAAADLVWFLQNCRISETARDWIFIMVPRADLSNMELI